MQNTAPTIIKDVRYLSSQTPGTYGAAHFTWLKPAGVSVAFLLSISPIERRAS